MRIVIDEHGQVIEGPNGPEVKTFSNSPGQPLTSSSLSAPGRCPGCVRRVEHRGIGWRMIHECAGVDETGERRTLIISAVGDGGNILTATISGAGLPSVLNLLSAREYDQVPGPKLQFSDTTTRTKLDALRADMASSVDVIYEEHQHVASPSRTSR